MKVYSVYLSRRESRTIKKKHCIQSKCAHDAKMSGDSKIERERKRKRERSEETRRKKTKGGSSYTLLYLIASMLIECFAMLFYLYSFVHSLYDT